MNIFNFIKDFFRSSKNRFFSNSYMLGQKGAVWLDTSKPYELYSLVPQAKILIDMRSQMFSNGEFKIRTKDGKVSDIKDKELLKLLNNPNVLQSQNDFLSEYEKQRLIYGNQFQYKNSPSTLSKLPIAMWNIPASNTKPILTGNWFEQTDIEGIITGYEYSDDIGGKKKRFEPKEILYSRVTNPNNPIIGESPLLGLIKPLTNIKHAYDYRNVIMSEKGAIGILSNQSKDAMGAMPLTPEEKSKLEKAYTGTYGIGDGQRRVHITNASLSWQPMTYPTRDLLLFEEVDANMITICDAFGLSINILSSKNATFENFKQSMIAAYENTIQPVADSYTQSLTKFLGITEGQLVLSYKHLAILQEDDQRKADVLTKNIAAILQMVQQKVINSSIAMQLIQQVTGLDFTNVQEQKQIIEIINSMSPLVANNIIQQLSINEIRDVIGYPSMAGGEQRPAAANADLQAAVMANQQG